MFSHPWKKHLAVLLLMLALAFGCMAFAGGIETAGGSIEVSEGVLPTDVGDLTFKLYRPESATEQNPAPAVLLLHGYQNDRETGSAYAIELARRGAVVLALDEYGHGGSEPGMIERGYVNHQAKVNYGLESEADGTFKTIGGPIRFRLLMNS